MVGLRNAEQFFGYAGEIQWHSSVSLSLADIAPHFEVPLKACARKVLSMSNLADTIINQVIGALIGTIVSFVVSWYFYKKADYPMRVTGEMTENILAMIIQNKLGENFDFYEVTPKSQLPKDLDVPHITQFWHTTKTPKQCESVLSLFRVKDTGLNFPGPQNVEVAETSSMIRFPVTRQGRGYYSCKVDFPDNATIGQNIVTFKLIDEKGKSHTQFVKFDVTSCSP